MSSRRAARLEALDDAFRVRRRRIPNDRDALGARQHQLQHFQALGFQVAGEHGYASEVASGPRKARDDPLRDRIPVTKTIGMVDVAALTARTVGGPPVLKMTWA